MPSSTLRARLRRAALPLAGAALVLVATALPAAAHTTLVSITPDQGSTLTQAPTRVTLRFDEDVDPSSKVVVTGPSGRVDHGGVRASGDRIELDVRLAPRPAYVGTYTIAYRVVSADGHPVSGESSFRYRPPGVEAAPGAASQDTADDRGTHVWWILGGVVVVVAAGALLLVPRRRAGRR